jgi:hypothetical protein
MICGTDGWVEVAMGSEGESAYAEQDPNSTVDGSRSMLLRVKGGTTQRCLFVNMSCFERLPVLTGRSSHRLPAVTRVKCSLLESNQQPSVP